MHVEYRYDKKLIVSLLEKYIQPVIQNMQVEIKKEKSKFFDHILEEHCGSFKLEFSPTLHWYFYTSCANNTWRTAYKVYDEISKSPHYEYVLNILSIRFGVPIKKVAHLRTRFSWESYDEAKKLITEYPKVDYYVDANFQYIWRGDGPDDNSMDLYYHWVSCEEFVKSVEEGLILLHND